MSSNHKDLFSGLVMMLGQSALLHMGKLVNPATGKTETRLEYAQEAIDTLDMLEIRTRGNLDADEARLLKTTLSSLKLTYVDTLQQPAAKPDAAPAAPPAAAPAEAATPAADSAPADAESKVRFHKKFD